jgi:uncharacterized protein
MKIQISGLSEGVHHYQFTVAPEALELGEEFHAQVVVDTTLDKTPNQILVTSSIRTVALFACDRCTDHFEELLTPSYRMFYVIEGAETEHLDPVEFQQLLPGQAVIDIADDVRQTLLLAVPLKLLCSENCRGLCPTCGKNLNEGECSCRNDVGDPRWDVLRNLQSNA